MMSSEIHSINLASMFSASRPRIFLSYAHADKENPILVRLLNDLTKDTQIEVWLDSERIRAGDEWLRLVSEGIGQADIFLILWTRHYGLGKWTNIEWEQAYAHQIRNRKALFVFAQLDTDVSPNAWRRGFFEGIVPSYKLNFHSAYDQAIEVLRELIRDAKCEPIAEFEIDRTDGKTSLLQVSDEVNEALIAYFEKNPGKLKTLDRRLFEKLVAELFDGFGYEVELTSATRDGGKDIVALRHSIVKEKFLIECKRPDPGKKVSIKPVRELLGVKADQGATKAILVTTANFTRDAKLLFERNKWELEGKEFDDLVKWIKDYIALKQNKSIQ